VLPAGEFDILGGDLNASRFDDKIEQFFVAFDTGDWAALAPTGYPTRGSRGCRLRQGATSTI
jgi:hypothetical protein